MSILDKNGLQILLVIDDKNILKGILTDGDIRRHLLKNRSMDIAVEEIANANFFAITENQIEKLDILFIQKSLRHIPITNSKGVLKSLALKSVFPNQERYSSIPVVIMAGGKGSRLAPLTRIIPKALIPIGEKTMIEKIMEGFYKQNFTDFKIITNYKKKLIKSYLVESNLPYDISFLEEDKDLGTVGGIKLFESELPDYFLLNNCDVLADINHHDLIENHLKTQSDLTILGVRRTTNIQYGVLDLDEDSLLLSVNEKPKYTHIINAGVYVFNKSILNLIPEHKEFNMDQLINKLLVKEKKISAFIIDDGWFDIGEFDEYRKLLSHIIE
jgi:dTDP-glucose pyrophosphorylase